MKRGAWIVGGLGGLAVVAGLAVARKKPSSPKPSSPAIVPPPPDAVWLKSSPEDYGPPEQGAPSGGAGGAPAGGAPAQGNVSGGAPQGGAPSYAVYLTGTTQLLELDAGKFLDGRFGSLPVDLRPTRTQLGAIYSTFTNLGVDARGILRTRPSYEATNAALDLAAAWDVQKVPVPVSSAVRDFALMAWQQLPISPRSTA